MKSLRLLSAIFLVAAASICAAAQDRPWEYWRNSEGYLQNQYEVMLDLADKVLGREAPSVKPSPARQLALASIDAVLHDTRCDTSAFLNAFMQKRWAMAELYLYRSN